MSTWITFQQVNIAKNKKLLEKIKEGSFQDESTSEIKSLENELDTCPDITDDEIYNPLFQSKEKKEKTATRLKRRKEIVDTLNNFTSILDSIKYMSAASDEKERRNNVREMAEAIIRYGEISFSENIRNVEPHLEMLFKHTKLTEDEYRNLEKISFETWTKVFDGLDKEALSDIKNELDNHKGWFEGAFDTFVVTIKDIKLIFKGCDNKSVFFRVSIEDAKDKFQDDLIKEIMTACEMRPFSVPKIDPKVYY